MMQNAKKLALGYLAQAQALLPKVGIDDHPGDGGPDRGKRTRDDILRLYLGMAKAQDGLTSEAAIKNTLAKAASLVTVDGKPYLDLVELVVEGYLDQLWKAEALALVQKYDSVGYFAANNLPFMRVIDDKDASAVLREAIKNTEKTPQITERFAQYLAIAEAALMKGFADEKDAARAAALALAPRVVHDGRFGVLTVCLGISQSLPADRALAEQNLRKETADAPGYLAQGLILLGKKPEALAALGKLTKDSRPDDLPPRMVTLLEEKEYLAHVTRTKNYTGAWRDAKNTDFFIEAERRLGIALLAEKLDPASASARDWYRVYKIVQDNPDVAGRLLPQLKRKLRVELVEREKYWKQKASASELSMRQADISEYVEFAAYTDPPTALRLLPRLTEPRWRVDALVALAQAESIRSRPKGDAG
jgi:hypothetical protein